MSLGTRFVALLHAGALAACTLSGATNEPLGFQPASRLGPGVHRLAQLDFGERARFAECFELSCPGRTAKTFAIAPDHRASGPAQVRPASGGPVVTEPPQGFLITPAAAPSPAAAQRLTLHFKPGSATLTGEHRSRLRSALPDLHRSDRITVAGRTDDLGSEALNQSLALARGLAVRDYLLDIDPQLPARIAIDPRGRCCYVAGNDNERSRSRNRRVEIAYGSAHEVAP